MFNKHLHRACIPTPLTSKEFSLYISQAAGSINAMKAGSLGVATACPNPCQQETSEAGLMSPQEIMLDICAVLPSLFSLAACGLFQGCSLRASCPNCSPPVPFLQPSTRLLMIELFMERMRSEMQLSNLAMFSSSLSLSRGSGWLGAGEVTLSGGRTSLASVTTPEYQRPYAV